MRYEQQPTVICPFERLVKWLYTRQSTITKKFHIFKIVLHKTVPIHPKIIHKYDNNLTIIEF